MQHDTKDDIVGTTCATLPCDQVTDADCCLVGGCVRRRFGPQTPTSDRAALKRNAPALNGTKPARTNRDPRFIKRRRKVVLAPYKP